MKNQADRNFVPMARLRWLALVAISLLALGGWFYWRKDQPRITGILETPGPGVVLSESTARILNGLETTVEVRFFAPGDFGALPVDLAGYLTRVENLLAEYERVGAGKLRMIKNDPQSDPAAKAAAGAAGVVPFASENGEIVYLGLIIANGARSESITPLAPEWEAALEPDITRAIARVVTKPSLTASPVAQTSALPTPIDPVISEELLRTFPNLASQTFDDTAKILREGALEEFKTAAAEMQSKVSAAQKALAAAHSNKSEAAQQAALKLFQTVQAEEADKLKAITARLQERITVLERLKTAPPSSVAAPQP